MDEVLRMVKGFQIADKHGVAMPANWPDNELVKDEVIIPPAADIKTAQADNELVKDEVIIPPAADIKTAQGRMKKYECFDWWFCHKKL